MIGYILIGIGAYLVFDDIKQAKRGKNANLLENGRGGTSGDPDSKPSAASQKPNRNGRVKSPIGVPAKAKGVKEHELYQESIQQVEPDKAGNSVRDDSSGKPNKATISGQVESVKTSDKPTVNVENVKGGDNAGNKINLENGNSDNGDNVRLEPTGVNESNGAKID